MTDNTRPISVDRLRELATIAPTLSLSAESAAELRALAATVLQLRDENATLLEQANRHRANVEGFESALTQVEHEKSILEQGEAALRAERDQARNDLVKALQTIELNAGIGMPHVSLCEHPSMCACCGRMRGDGRRDRRWVYPIVSVDRALRFTIRIAFCAKCFDELETHAAKLRGKEQHEQPGELEEGDRG
jgi:hypothetical protein